MTKFAFDSDGYKRYNDLVYELDRVIAHLKRAQAEQDKGHLSVRDYHLIEAGRIVLDKIGPENLDISTEV